MESLKQQAEDCGPGCGCHASGTSGKVRWVICGIVLLAAGLLVARAMIKADDSSGQAAATTFVAPVADESAAEIPAAEVASTSETSPGTVTQAAATSVGTMVGAFAELNASAVDTDVVFVFLPGKGAASGAPPATAMQAAVRTLEAKGIKCGLFTLKPDSADYNQLEDEVSVPGVLAMVKGGGTSPVSGEITETKLVQGYVAASSAGGCSSGGCGPGGCN